ncbi:TPA: histidine phosphatase family protein [Streptococcus suis]
MKFTCLTILHTCLQEEEFMVEIYLIRHAESIINGQKERVFCGQYDCLLTQKGVKQAKVLSLINIDFDVAYISDLTRAKETFYLSGLFASKVYYLKCLRERSLGDFEGKKVNIIFSDINYKEYWPEGEFRDFRFSFDQAAPNGESYSDVCSRLEPIVNKLKNFKNNEKILIISHYHTIRCLLYLLDLVDINSIFDKEIDNCEVIKLIV